VDPFEEVTAALADGRAALADARTPEALAAARLRFLGKRGLVAGLMDRIRAIPQEDRARFGQAVNRLKADLQADLDARAAEVGAAPEPAAADATDLTLPGIRPDLGALHPVTQVAREVVRVFESLGFEETEGPEIEDEFHNFVALNIPPQHPARDEADNFYVDGRRLLRSQTSTVQIRALESRPLPLRIVALGRVFRPDTVDATHHYMFHQIEGLAVDHGLSLADLKSTLLKFVRALFGADVDVRLRPSFFPFTEPSAEIDVKFPDRGYVEIGGCGMVDPNVFEAVGVDAAEWSGFAFGLGIERLAMRRFGIPDIRRLTECDARFLRQLG
jgi:phenylalanyl-tRNA synthetase alpha chain